MKSPKLSPSERRVEMSANDGSLKAPLKTKPAVQRATHAAARSKIAGIITLMRRPTGTTIDALVKTTGWKPHSVRGAISGTIKKRLKLKVQSEKREGVRRYRIAG